ncbi:MAG: hypothetical protein ACKOFG_17290, partial [Limnohabitans sp.]
QWVETVTRNGAQVELVYIEGMAHNAFFGPLRQQRATWASGQTYGASLGATEEARARRIALMRDFIAAKALPR